MTNLVARLLLLRRLIFRRRQSVNLHRRHAIRRRQFHHANRMIVRVRDVQLSARRRNPARLIERRRRSVAIRVARLSRASNRAASRFPTSITLILLLYVSATYSLPSAQATPSGCCSRTSPPLAVHVAEIEQRAGQADQRLHLPGRIERHRPHRAPFAVGDKQPFAVRRQPARLRERCEPRSYGIVGSSGPSTMSSRPLPAYGPIALSSSGIFQI